jgi:hypothetical protein
MICKTTETRNAQAISSFFLRLGVHRTRFLATDSKNRIHVVVTHVGTLGCLVFGVHGEGKLRVHCVW